jgi:hypothetical protein
MSEACQPKPCPCCGTCPTCGRRPNYVPSIYEWPVRWWYQPTIINTPKFDYRQYTAPCPSYSPTVMRTTGAFSFSN